METNAAAYRTFLPNLMPRLNILTLSPLNLPNSLIAVLYPILGMDINNNIFLRKARVISSLSMKHLNFLVFVTISNKRIDNESLKLLIFDKVEKS